MQHCNAVIFDLGGVILDINYKATEQGLRDVLGPQADAHYKQTRQTALFDDLETGRVEPGAFRDALRRLAGSAVNDASIDAAWNAMLGSLPEARLKFLQRVAHSRRIFLLSNTNVIHKAAFDRIAGPHFDGYFEAAYYSHLIGLRKPDPAIYRFVTDRHGLEPARTLFIDDNKDNVEGARQAGLQGFHLQGELLTSELVALLA